MSERSGILMALASSALGGIASVAIRFMVATTDPGHARRGALRAGRALSPAGRIVPRGIGRAAVENESTASFWRYRW